MNIFCVGREKNWLVEQHFVIAGVATCYYLQLPFLFLIMNVENEGKKDGKRQSWRELKIETQTWSSGTDISITYKFFYVAIFVDIVNKFNENTLRFSLAFIESSKIGCARTRVHTSTWQSTSLMPEKLKDMNIENPIVAKRSFSSLHVLFRYYPD